MLFVHISGIYDVPRHASCAFRVVPSLSSLHQWLKLASFLNN